MFITILHAAITYLVPLLCGIGAACCFCRGHRRWFEHAFWCVLAVGISLVAQYGAFVVFAGLMTGDWPVAFPLNGLLYALAWFAIAAIFTTVPSAIAGYVLGRALLQPMAALKYPG